jgi:WD40 repeat protein
VTVASFSPNNRYLAYGGRDGLSYLDLRDGKSHKISKEAIYNQVLAFSADGTLLTTQNAVWKVKEEEMLSLSGYGDVSLAEFSSDGRWLVTSGKSKVIQLWDLKANTLALELEDHADLVTGVTFSKDLDYLISASRDKTIRLWDLKTKNWVLLGRFSGAINQLYRLKDGSALSGGEDGFVRRWQIEPAPKENFTQWLEEKTTLQPDTE